jgi:hypothetical protein
MLTISTLAIETPAHTPVSPKTLQPTVRTRRKVPTSSAVQLRPYDTIGTNQDWILSASMNLSHTPLRTMHAF